MTPQTQTAVRVDDLDPFPPDEPASLGPVRPAPEVLPAGSGTTAAAAAASRLTFTSSPSIGHLVGALAAAQLEFGTIERSLTANVESKRTGVKYSYDYADLAAVLTAVRPALARQGIATLQPTSIGQRAVTVTTLLAHSSGEFIRNDFMLPIDSTDPQAIGSAVTYARRYALQSLLGVAPEDDDDGRRAQGSDARGRVSEFRPGQGPVQMPQRAEVGQPSSPGSSPTAPSASTTSAAQSATPLRPAPDSGPTTFTITHLEARQGANGPYWLVAFSNGVKGCTFDKTFGDQLSAGRAAGTRYTDVKTRAKGQWTYVEGVTPATAR